ncbi:MAG: hypothetical protein EOP05_15250, partial [Proteobacteria bacterium]
MFTLKTHNIIDYVLGAFLLVSPWLFGFDQIVEARVLFLLSGVVLITYSLITNYYFSVARIIPLGVHMTMDAILGVLLILAPALFGYRGLITEAQYVAHVLVGVGTVGLVALTKPKSEAAKSPVERISIRQDLEV